MANEKLFKLTKNEAYFLKKILPSCKLTAYQIPLFQSVMNALDKPIKISDEIDKMNRVYPTIDIDINDVKLPPAAPVVHHPYNAPVIPPVSTGESLDKLNKIAQHFQSPGMVKPIIQERPIETIVPVVEETPIESVELDSDIEESGASMFDVIDSRSK